MVNLQNVRTLFTFHPPSEEQKVAYAEIRERAYDLARCLILHCPEGPDREIAILKVREASMLGNAAIATHNAAAS